MNDFQAPLASGSMAAPAPTTPPPPTIAPAPQRGPRLWPAVVIVVLQWLIIKGAAWLAPASMFHFISMFWGPLVGAVAFLAWWLLASRVPWRQRLIVLAACGAIGTAAVLVRDPSFNGVGLFAFFLYALPLVTGTWILWLLLTRGVGWPVRQAGLFVLFALTWGYFTLFRFEGTDGDIQATLAYRWTPTAEEASKKYRAEAAAKPAPQLSAEPLTLGAGDWPGFRGADRDSRLTGERVAVDWAQHPPRQFWRHPVGPGWSSFAVIGSRLYTQEQREEQEAVVCYDAATGAEVWAHVDGARFSEAIAGPGPRATPTFHAGRIYALGASGLLNCLDAISGQVVWHHDIGADSGAKVPTWGFAASPLVVQGVVTVFAGGPENKSVLGYDAVSGELKWTAGGGKLSYGSLHPARLGGVEQLVLATEEGLAAFDPLKGTLLWQHDWPLKDGMARVIQPALVDQSSLLIGTGFGMGVRRVRVDREGDAWKVKEEWTTRSIKPYYNDLVVHKGYLYGFDGNFFTCVSLENGKSKWRQRGYGNGQVLLLADQELLLIISETGEVALVQANPEEHKELGRFQAIEGKTWNHPVVAHGKLYVRNGAEAACYQVGEAK